MLTYDELVADIFAFTISKFKKFVLLKIKNVNLKSKFLM